MTLMFIQGHRVTGKLDLVQSFCCKVANVYNGCLCKCDDYEEGPVLAFAFLLP